MSDDDAPLPVVRVAVLKYGTANWELEVIRERGLDRENGFRLEVLTRVSPAASLVALQGGAADFTVSDWLWVARQHAAGRDFRYFPYSTAVGELLVPPTSEATSLVELGGAELGVAGGAEDKSWLIFQAFARRRGFDLSAQTRPRYAAPPLLNGLAQTGQLDAVLTYWHYAARLKAVGFRPLLSLDDVLGQLGIDGQVPMLGWVFSGAYAQRHPERVDAFLDASYAAKALLESDDSVWALVEPLMQADNREVFTELQTGYRAGVPDGLGPDGIAAVREVSKIVDGASPAPVGDAAVPPPSVFWQHRAGRP